MVFSHNGKPPSRILRDCDWHGLKFQKEETHILKAILLKLNDLKVFDPSMWPRRELLARLAGAAACLGFVIHRIFKFESYTGSLPSFLKPLTMYDRVTGAFIFTTSDWHWLLWFGVWLIETGIFLGYLLSFITRSEAKQVAKGFMEVVFPFIIAALPMLIVLTPMNFRRQGMPLTAQGNLLFVAIVTIILLGGIINLIGLLSLRRAFTITSEARLLIRRGLFSIMRHPLYTGHFIMFFGYLLLHFYWHTTLIYFLFILGQAQRARIEERKLASAFPEYREYKRATGMFFPRIFVKKSGSKV